MSSAPPRRLRAAVPLGALVVALSLAACTPSPGQAASSPSPSPSASPDVDDVGPRGLELDLTSGDVTVQVVAPHALVDSAHVTLAKDGVATLTVDPAALPSGAVLDVAPEMASLAVTLRRTSDGGASVLDADGKVIGGLTAPTGGARLVVVEPDAAELHMPSGAQAVPPPVTLTMGTQAVVSATWGNREGGRSLAVDPTPWARTAGAAGVALVWAELTAAHPDADTPGMHDQLVCHSVGAPDKATWNLEPWRPDVGLVAVLAARCNPS
ncbi:MAG: DUF2599 domain-containing protein [Promicromonosporaceae bacterium]|nr:DUF2599 domain-containing protein [Promicromonosporaceae bacterium]